MANQPNGKSIRLAYIVIAIIVIVVGVCGFFMLTGNGNYKDAKSAEQITISNNDSKEVKIEKIQKKLELLNKEIDELQNKINPELEKLNSLYEEYTNNMNQNQPVETATAQPTTAQPTTEQPTGEEQTVQESTEETPAEDEM